MATRDKVYKMILQRDKKDSTAADLKPEASLVDALNLDSLDLAQLLILAEDAFSTEIPFDDTECLKTVADVVTYFEKCTAG
jgi:acyl carrier protein